MFLQAGIPGLLHRHHTITEGFFTPPQDLIRHQVETFEGFPQKVLLHSMLLTQDTQHYYKEGHILLLEICPQGSGPVLDIRQ